MCVPDGQEKFWRVVDVRRLEARLHPVGEVVRRPGLERGLGDGHPAVGAALHGVPAALELEVVLRHLELMSDDDAHLVEHLAGGLVERDAADGEATAAVRVHAKGDDRRVAVQDLDVVDVDAEPVGGDLRDRRHVTLAVRRGADQHLDGAGR